LRQFLGRVGGRAMRADTMLSLVANLGSARQCIELGFRTCLALDLGRPERRPEWCQKGAVPVPLGTEGGPVRLGAPRHAMA
jgi:hypothetical protein